jgi:hypothetical protein
MLQATIVVRQANLEWHLPAEVENHSPLPYPRFEGIAFPLGFHRMHSVRNLRHFPSYEISSLIRVRWENDFATRI